MPARADALVIERALHAALALTYLGIILVGLAQAGPGRLPAVPPRALASADAGGPTAPASVP